MTILKLIMIKILLNKANIFSEWSEWSSCSKDCNTGNKTRTKTCLNCNQTQIEYLECNQQPCLSDWSEWSLWSECKFIYLIVVI